MGSLVFPSTPDAPHGKPVANFYDYQARIEWNVAGGRLRLLALGSSDEAGLKQDSKDTSTALLTSIFHKADLGWRGPLAGGTLDANVNLGTERLGLLGERDGQMFGQFLLERQGVAGRVRWQRKLSESFSLDVGVEVDWLTATVAIDREPGLLTGAAASFRAPRTTGLLPGAWAAVDWRSGPWAVTLGARVDGWGLMPNTWRWSADPRLSVRYAVNDRLSLRASAGLAHQQPTVLINLPVSDLAGLRDGLQEGAHFELGADAALPLGLDASASLFYEPIFRAVEYGLEDLLQNQARLTDTPGLPGRAYGVELMLRHAASGRWFGWLSYTFLRSERLRRVYEFSTTGDVTGSALRWLPFDYDQAHVVNLTGGVVLPYGFRVSAGLHFNTGRLEAGRVTSRAMQPGVDPGTLQPTWVPVSLSTEPRLPAFFRVDARVSKTFVTEYFTLELYLDVLNASATQEVLGYLYGAKLDDAGNRVLTKQAISIPLVLPSLGVKGVY